MDFPETNVYLADDDVCHPMRQLKVAHESIDLFIGGSRDSRKFAIGKTRDVGGP